MTATLLILLGVACLYGGGEALVRGSTALARRLGVSTLVIGLTVVAFGTSAPELAVNLTAALKGQSGISFGNVIGSNIANLGLILGLSALLHPLQVLPGISRREIPFMLAATVVAVLLTGDAILGGSGGFDRIDGLILLAAFGLFLVLTLRRAAGDRRARLGLTPAAMGDADSGPDSLALAVGLTLLGLVGVVLGGHWTVAGATAAARALGVGEEIIGLSIVAVGTSLPELAASLAAVRKGQSDLAVGNVVGSNLFNLLLVLGPTVLIRPFPVPAGGGADLVALLAFSALLVPAMVLRGRPIRRAEGALFLVAYLGYVGWRTLGG